MCLCFPCPLLLLGGVFVFVFVFNIHTPSPQVPGLQLSNVLGIPAETQFPCPPMNFFGSPSVIEKSLCGLRKQTDQTEKGQFSV